MPGVRREQGEARQDGFHASRALASRYLPCSSLITHHSSPHGNFSPRVRFAHQSPTRCVVFALIVLALGLMPFVFGVIAWRMLGRDDSSTSDDGSPPPPPLGPRPVEPTSPCRRRDRGAVHSSSVRTRRPLDKQ